MAGVEEVHILWISEGMSCDGDSVSVTAAGQPGIEDVLVVEGSIPNEKINGDGYWTSFGNDEATGEPLTLNWWIDRLAHKAWGVIAIGTCATYGGIHAMAGN